MFKENSNLQLAELYKLNLFRLIVCECVYVCGEAGTLFQGIVSALRLTSAVKQRDKVKRIYASCNIILSQHKLTPELFFTQVIRTFALLASPKLNPWNIYAMPFN